MPVTKTMSANFAVHKNGIGRLDVPVDHSVLLERTQGASDGRPRPHTFGDGETADLVAVISQGFGLISFRRSGLAVALSSASSIP